MRFKSAPIHFLPEGNTNFQKLYPIHFCDCVKETTDTDSVPEVMKGGEGIGHDGTYVTYPQGSL